MTRRVGSPPAASDGNDRLSRPMPPARTVGDLHEERS